MSTPTETQNLINEFLYESTTTDNMSINSETQSNIVKSAHIEHTYKNETALKNLLTSWNLIELADFFIGKYI